MRKQVLRVMLGSTGLVAGVLVGFPGVAHADTVTIDCPSHVGDVTQLRTAISGAVGARTIEIPPNCVFTVTAPYLASENAMPIVEDPITITSRYSTITRSSESLFRIFEVGATGSLTVQGVTVSNGNLDDDGGCYYVNSGGSLTLTRSPVMDCTAGDDSDGGGIYVEGIPAAGPLPAEVHGARATSKPRHGGELALAGRTARARQRQERIVYDVVLNKSDLVGNTATDDGGGIYSGYGTDVEFIHVLARDNTATEEGGGVMANGAEFDINSSTLTLNTAFEGGGIDAQAGLVNLNGSWILTNSANQGGGMENDTTTTLFNTAVTGNTALPTGNSGGGIFLDTGTVLLHNSPVTANIPNNCRPLASVTNCFG